MASGDMLCVRQTPIHWKSFIPLYLAFRDLIKPVKSAIRAFYSTELLYGFKLMLRCLTGIRYFAMYLGA